MLNEFWQTAKAHPGAMAAVFTAGLFLVALLQLLGFGKILSAFWERLILEDMGSPDPEVSDIEAKYERLGRRGSDRIRFQNTGDRIAKDVDLEILKTAGPRTPLVKGEYDRKLPTELRPGREFTMMVSRTKDTYPPHEVLLTWEGRDGKERSKELTLRD